ncbi:MAG: MFS transporter [Tannerellaceae bacterium]|jgi:MFS family permease|nr:MFS transporter [Tannerellaceae bacterium]
MTEIILKRLSDSKVARWLALFLVSFAMMCSYYVYDVVAPLEDLLLRNFQWTGTEYGIFSGAYAWFNVFLLMLIIGGVFLDKVGIRITGTLCCLLMTIGVVIKAYALSDYFPFEGNIIGYDARMIVACVGFSIFGLGAETSYVAMNKIVVKWFDGRELALAMGLQVALARIGTACALSFSLPVAMHFHSLSAPVWLGAISVLIGFLAFSVYCTMDKKEDRSTNASVANNKLKEDEFKVSDIKSVLVNKGFWLIAILCLLFYSGIFPFLKYATKLMIYKYGAPESLAGIIPAILPFGTILLTPVFGRIYDAVGKGATLMFIGSFMLMLVHILFAMPALNEWWFATLLMVLLGIAFSLVPSAMWPSVTKIIPQKKLGTAFALIFYIQNCGLMLVPLLIGWTIDRYATIPGETVTYDYSVTMFVFAVFGALAMLFALWLKKTDKEKGYGLELPSKKIKQ